MSDSPEVSIFLKWKKYLSVAVLYAIPLCFLFLLTRDGQHQDKYKKVAEIYEDDHLIITGIGNKS